MTASAPAHRELVYGERAGQLLFIPRERALELASIWSALETSRTWGEFKERAPVPAYRQVLDTLTELHAEDPGAYPLPADGDPFDIDQVRGVADGDWPGWPAQEMLEWMPDDVRKRFGRVESSVLNGFFLELDPRQADAIVAALEEHGYRCTEDVELIEQAHGR